MALIQRIEKFNENGYVGWKVSTNKGDISLSIENVELCCEDFGANLYMGDLVLTDENMLDFFFVDDEIETVKFDADPRFRNDDKRNQTSITIEICGEVHDLTLVVYNEHDGYYSHAYVAEIFGKRTCGSL